MDLAAEQVVPEVREHLNACGTVALFEREDVRHSGVAELDREVLNAAADRGLLAKYWAERQPDRIALRSAVGDRTFAEVAANANRLVRALRASGVQLHELEIPHGPCASFVAEGDQRFAIYELVRPDANAHFSGRIDP